MEKNEAADPIDVGLFGSKTVMFAPDHIPHVIEQFGIARGSAARRVATMFGILSIGL